ncbi:uncharacterized protein FIBRA_05645 [Fibroporia radiculosa]|uniref:Peroxidase n=1 Tax=Fibroporia radiculosa TaxID=599839 RepID=J4IAU3_9APHY|nr:uncharacterized protein FIBRA_05645 [Fibroporia radiculosa]CCM03511.1 predicted protein [Fibroporia radiculosa]
MLLAKSKLKLGCGIAGVYLGSLICSALAASTVLELSESYADPAMPGHTPTQILDDMQANVFDGGRCGDQAREAIRLTFHDGIGQSVSLRASGHFGGGGAGECDRQNATSKVKPSSKDGSIIQFASVELADPANEGLDDIVYALKIFADSHDISYGDMVQFAGAVALSNCPGSPRLEFFAGRPKAIAPAPPRLIPSPSDSVEHILARMEDAGLSPEDTVALLAAHSVAVQKTVDPSVSGMPLDSTPEAFDTQFYLEITVVSDNPRHF